MKAFVYIGGGIDPAGLDEHPGEGELCIAADSGWRNARRLGVRVNLLVGDMDSLGAEAGSAMAEVEALGGEVMRVPAEKDETDTQLAVHEAVRRGADEIVIVGGLSGRLDHTLANLSVLEALAEHRISARITDGRNRVRFLKNDSLLLAAGGFRYLSLIPVDEVCRGVSAEGCRYPLKGATLRRTNAAYSTSNEILGPVALVSVRRGRLFVVESRED